MTVVGLIEVGRFGKAWQQVATVAIGGLNAIVGNGLIDERDVVAVDADRVEGVGIARLVVGVEAEVAQTAQVEIVEDGSLGPILDALLHRLIVLIEGVLAAELTAFGQTRANIIKFVAPHVAIEGIASRERETPHVDQSPRETAIGGQVVEVVGIDDVGRLGIVDGPAATTTRIDVDLRERVVAIET